MLNDEEKKNLLIKLTLQFPKKNLNEIKTKLNKENFFSIGKRLTAKEKDQFWLMGNKAFVYDAKPSRLYPQKNLFSHILGQTNDVNEGISGIEKYLNNDLSDNSKIDSPLSLTLDSNLQYLIRNELIKAKTDFNTIGSGAIWHQLQKIMNKIIGSMSCSRALLLSWALHLE